MDVAIVIDSSSSVRRDNYETVKSFLIDLVDKMHVSHRMTHVGIIHYNHKSFLDWDFSEDKAQNAAALKKAIKNLKYEPGGTRTDRGMNLASKEMFQLGHGERSNVPHVLLVITDGKTSPRSEKYKDVVKPFKVIKFNPSNPNSDENEISFHTSTTCSKHSSDENKGNNHQG